MKITIAPGDGIGPEIMDVVVDVLRVCDVPLQLESVALGHDEVMAGEPTGIGAAARRSIESTGVLLKGPTDVPEGSGLAEAGAEARRFWDTFARKRIYRMLPGVPSPIGHRSLGLTIVHETQEERYETTERYVDLGVAQSRSFTTRAGSMRLHRYAFEMAARKGAKHVTCAHQADVLRVTDGLFLETFRLAAEDWSDLTTDEVPVDRVARRLLVEPEAFDVLVVPESTGDLLNEVAVGIVGGPAYAPSASIGEDVAIFEPVHGTARDAAGQDLANPTALLLSATMALRHVGLVEHAARIERAVDAALFRMHRSPEVRKYVRRFQTSVFRYLLLDELQRDPGDVPGTLPVARAERRRYKLDEPSAPGPAGLALDSAASQLNGLA